MSNGINSTPYADMRALLIHASERNLLAADDWHSLFFWKPHSRKQFHYNKINKLISEDGLQLFYIRSSGFYAETCFDRCIDTFLSVNPTMRYSQASDKLETEYPMSAYLVVMYERTVNSPHLQELSELQEAMEHCLSELNNAEQKRETSKKGLKSLFRKTRETSACEIEAATIVVNERISEFDFLVNRLKEIRADILQGR